MRFTPSRSLSSSQLSRRSIALGFASLPMAGLALTGTAHASRAAGTVTFDADLVRARAKVAAYLDLIDGTFPIGAMWRRYTGFVHPERGPTGREIRINGLMPARDMGAEIAAARAQRERGPAFAECDAAIDGLIRLHGEMAPLVTEAAAYFDLAVHREDEGAKAREFHQRLRKLVPQFLAARTEALARLEPIRGVVEQAELAVIERAVGRDARWHIRRATVEARKVIAVFPQAGGVIDLDRLDAALTVYDGVVDETEAFGRANPQALIAFGSSPRGFSAGIRRVRERIAAFPASPKRWAPEIGDIDGPFQSLAKMADAMLLNIA